MSRLRCGWVNARGCSGGRERAQPPSEPRSCPSSPSGGDAALPRAWALRRRRFSRNAAALLASRSALARSPASVGVGESAASGPRLGGFRWSGMRGRWQTAATASTAGCRRLEPGARLWQEPGAVLERCRSSVVEHSLGKGEVRSSILRGSTIPGRMSCLTHGRARCSRRARAKGGRGRAGPAAACAPSRSLRRSPRHSLPCRCCS